MISEFVYTKEVKSNQLFLTLTILGAATILLSYFMVSGVVLKDFLYHCSVNQPGVQYNDCIAVFYQQSTYFHDLMVISAILTILFFILFLITGLLKKKKVT